MENIQDWTSFRKRIVIHKPANLVYDCWTLKSEIEKWFLEKASYLHDDQVERGPDENVEQGDLFIWKWNNWDMEEKGKILEANGHDRISFTFGKGGNVHVELTEGEKGTELVLIQDCIPIDENSKMNLFVGCSTGWTFWLTNLKAYLEHGITLHARGLQQDETTDLVNS